MKREDFLNALLKAYDNVNNDEVNDIHKDGFDVTSNHNKCFFTFWFGFDKNFHRFNLYKLN